MFWLTTIAIWNAFYATVLATIAYVYGRYSKNAAVNHALWVFVLVALFAPPLLHIPLRVLPSDLVQQLAPDAAFTHADKVVQQGDSVSSSVATRSAEGSTRTDLLSRLTRPRLFRALTAAWVIGAAACVLYRCRIICQMWILMRHAEPSPRLDRSMHRIAKRAGVQNYPISRVVPWATSPMLWGFGSASVIVLPAKLLKLLDDDASDTLLLHELGHFQRGDQWVRILEGVASTVFWWHPVVWLAKREIEIHEEQCVDGWVVRQNLANRRCYAEALLQTVDFLSDAPTPVTPIAASGLGRVVLLERRLKAIMHDRHPTGRGPSGLLIAALLVVVVARPKLLPAASSLSSAIERDSATALNDTTAPVLLRTNESFDTKQKPNLEETTNGQILIPSSDFAKANSACGRFQLIASSGYRCRLVELAGGRELDLSKHEIACVAFNPRPKNASTYFAAGSLNGSVSLIDCETGETIKLLASTGGIVQSIDYSSDGSRLAFGGQDGIVRILDPASPSNPICLPETFGPVRSVRFGADGRMLAVSTDTWNSSGKGQVDIWNVESKMHRRTIRCASAVGVASFSQQGDILTAEWNGVLRRWSPSGEAITSVVVAKDSVSAAAFSSQAASLEALMMIPPE